MNRWRAEYDDGIWRFYRDGMELGLYEKGDVVVGALNVAESRIAELEAEIDEFLFASSNVLNPYDGISVPYEALKKLVKRVRKERER